MLILLASCASDEPAKPPEASTGESCTPVFWYADGDGDGVGGDTAAEACEAPEGFVAGTGDCDDGDATVGAETTWYRDYDRDGWGDAAGDTVTQCDPLDGYAEVAGDCDDHDAELHPDATEICDRQNVDEDCDGLSDDADDDVDTTTFGSLYPDDDDDGFGAGAPVAEGCDAREGLTTDGTDCDDSDAAVNPDASEVCNEIDDDCDTLVDEADDSLEAAWYRDGDGDGYGDEVLNSCDAPDGYVALGGDCDETDPAIHPGADEVCLDLVDQDCDGYTDEYTGVCEPVVDGAVADRCDVSVTPADVALCASGIAAVLSDGSVYTTLRHALDAAVAGDVLTVCPGRWEEGIAVEVTPFGIAGYGSGVSVIAPISGSAIEVPDSGELTVVGVTLEGGNERNGGGVYVGRGASLCIASSQLGLNRSDHGGGAIAVPDTASAVVDACTFYANETDTSWSGGAIAADDGDTSVLVEDSAFVLNSAQLDGGAVWVGDGGTLTAENVVFERNASGSGGGAIAFEGASLDLMEARFEENDTLNRGGAIQVDGTLFTGHCDACTFLGHATDYDGGAVWVRAETGTFDFTGSTFERNETLYYGGALHVRGTDWDVTLEACTFTENLAGDEGGAIQVGSSANGTLTVTRSTFTQNVAVDGGAAWVAPDSDLVFTSSDTTWSDNTPDDVNGYSWDTAATFTCVYGVCE
ncbi:MAG: putative metal-binding motif-containing protein [Myxococcota bacterium]